MVYKHLLVIITYSFMYINYNSMISHITFSYNEDLSYCISTMEIDKYLLINTHLVGVVPTPLKNMSSSIGIMIPKIWEIKKCSKPPIRYIYIYISINPSKSPVSYGFPMVFHRFHWTMAIHFQ